MKKSPFFYHFFLPVLLMTLFISCKKETGDLAAPATPESFTAMSTSSLNAANRDPNAVLLQTVRQATSRFNSTVLAMSAGYEPDDHCVSVPGLGGMGYHWVNSTLVDPVFDPEKPEVVLYARGAGNNLRLVAVEYIVVNVGQPAPMFGDQPFMEGGTPLPIPHWSLHVWMYENNPAGMFEPFNPNISCP